VCGSCSERSVYQYKTNAQALKIGYFDEQQLLPLFPGIGKIDTLMAIYQSDSLGVEYNYTYADYMRRDSML
jgi:hypothetical protein